MIGSAKATCNPWSCMAHPRLPDCAYSGIKHPTVSEARHNSPTASLHRRDGVIVSGRPSPCFTFPAGTTVSTVTFHRCTPNLANVGCMRHASTRPPSKILSCAWVFSRSWSGDLAYSGRATAASRLRAGDGNTVTGGNPPRWRYGLSRGGVASQPVANGTA